VLRFQPKIATYSECIVQQRTYFAMHNKQLTIEKSIKFSTFWRLNEDIIVITNINNINKFTTIHKVHCEKDQVEYHLLGIHQQDIKRYSDSKNKIGRLDQI